MSKVPGIIRPAKVMLLGQAPGATEAKRGTPFCGPAGHELDKWLVQAGLATKRRGPLTDKEYVDRGELAITNVWDEELPAGGLAEMTATRKEAKEEGWETRGTPLVRGRYLREKWWGWQERLAEEIRRVAPNLIIGFGNEALWALNGHTGIESWRGAPFMSAFGVTEENGSRRSVKAICTFHPAGILRGGYRNRPLAIADLIKAAGQAETPHLELPRRELWLSPTLHDVCVFFHRYLFDASWLSIDIETGGGEITSVAFAPSPRLGICLPFVVDGGHYWERASEEVAAWKWVRDACEAPMPKVLQNGMYDAQWLWVKRGIRLINYREDTRLMHHALFPELPKSLSFMGALWENEQAWKMWSARHSEKRDDS